MKRVILLAVTMGLIAAMTFGAGVELADVGAEAKWVAHIDLDAVRESEVGKMMMQGEEWAEFETKMAALKDVIGVDLSKDLSTATLYGLDYSEKKNVAIVRGAMDIAKIKTLISLMQDYQENEAGNGLVYTWVDEKKGKPVACAFHGDDSVIFAEDIEVVANALAVLDRRAPALGTKTTLRLPEASSGAFMSFGAVEHDGKLGRQKAGAMAGQVDWVSLGVGEKLGKVSLKLAVGAKTSESAMQVEQVLQGFRALAMMSEDLDPQTRKVLTGATVSRSDKEVRISISGDVEMITKMIKDGQKNAMRGKRNGSKGSATPGTSAGTE
jgi:hypothetical protein